VQQGGERPTGHYPLGSVAPPQQRERDRHQGDTEQGADPPRDALSDHPRWIGKDAEQRSGCPEAAERDNDQMNRHTDAGESSRAHPRREGDGGKHHRPPDRANPGGPQQITEDPISTPTINR